MERDIRGEILSASFWENWNYYKELCKSNSQKKFKQRDETERIRRDWIEHQRSQRKEDE